MEPRATKKIEKIEAKEKRDVAKVDAKEKKQVADDEAKKVEIDTKAKKEDLAGTIEEINAADQEDCGRIA